MSEGKEELDYSILNPIESTDKEGWYLAAVYWVNQCRYLEDELEEAEERIEELEAQLGLEQ